jgi:hypothetical protein
MDVASDLGNAALGALGLKQGKAKLVIKGTNKPDDAEPMECMFNPTEYKLSQSSKVERGIAPAKPGGTLEYKATSQMKLSMELFFDDFASIKGDVTPKITKLLNWQKPTKSSIEKKRPSPPYVGFEWGNKQLANFKGLLTSVNIAYTVFRKDGTPIQAKVNITIEGDAEIKAGKNPTSHAIDTRRVHTTVQGETLHSVAYAEFGRPAYWRAIAELNGIDDPLRVAAGTALLIPTLADAARKA